MTKKTLKHLQHYLPLMGILGAGIIGFYIFSYDRLFQFFIAIAVSLSYVTWGLVHHYIHQDFHLSVLIEYLVIAILALVVIFSILFRA
jgi:EamA domain-containing membrane protein RarD